MGRHKAGDAAVKPKLMKAVQAAHLADKNSRTITKIVQLLEVTRGKAAGVASADPEGHIKARIEKLTSRLNRRLAKLAKWADNPSDERQPLEMRGYLRSMTMPLRSSYAGYIPMQIYAPQPAVSRPISTTRAEAVTPARTSARMAALQNSQPASSAKQSEGEGGVDETKNDGEDDENDDADDGEGDEGDDDGDGDAEGDDNGEFMNDDGEGADDDNNGDGGDDDNNDDDEDDGMDDEEGDVDVGEGMEGDDVDDNADGGDGDDDGDEGDPVDAGNGDDDNIVQE